MGVGYDSNVFAETGGATEDGFGRFLLQVPVEYRPSQRLGLAGRYSNMGEAYQTLSELDNPQARSSALVGLRWSARERTVVRLDAIYGETNRPAELFTDSGLEFGREHTTSRTASGHVEQRLGAHSKLDLGYTYRLGNLGSVQDAFHGVVGNVSRRFSSRTELGLGWSLERHVSETADQDDSAVVSAGWNQDLSRRWFLSLSVGARLRDSSEIRPEGRAILSWSRGSWSAQARYARSQSFVPRPTDLAGRLNTSDTVGLTLTHASRRLRLSLNPTYYWTRSSSLDIEVGRALGEVTFMANRWLGLSTAYSYQRQVGTQIVGASPQDASGSRGIAVVGILIAPWNRSGADSLQ
jgi:hypothetical protein